MDPTSSTASPTISRFKGTKRPDSLKLELLTIPEDGTVPQFGKQSIDFSVNVGFRNISYSVQEGILRRRPKQLLYNLSGDFYAGELTAIMGPSGSGKSTLMNILSGYTVERVEGDLLVNDEVRQESPFRKSSCYIMQDDKLQPLLTVMEAMTIAANLKLGRAYAKHEKDMKVQDILEAIGLWDCRSVATKSLSGGQRKRLSIALELLKNPQVMFFDEPTSGLDSQTSKQVVMLLKQIAISGRTIICTIHQPSATIFDIFDHLYALADGYCIYQGSIKGLVPYLEESGLVCPTYHNPADYLCEVASGEYGDHNQILSSKSENGKNNDWRKTHRHYFQLQNKNDNVNRLIDSTTVEISTQHAKTLSLDHLNSCYATSVFHQIFVLAQRTFLVISRDRTLAYSRVASHLIIALFIGILYYDIGTDASNMLNNLNYMFFSVMFLMFTAFNCITLTFPLDLPIITKEHFNKWYSLKSYYLAVTLADIPIQLFSTLTYALVTYILTQQPLEFHRIVSYIFICILISFVAQSYGLCVGATLDIKNGVIFGPFVFLPFTIFSGFFVQLNDAHPYMRWIFHISFLKYGLEGLVLSVLGYDRGKLPCNADYCHFRYPEKFLDQMDMKYADYSTAAIFLIGLIGLLRIAAFYALSFQIRRRR